MTKYHLFSTTMLVALFLAASSLALPPPEKDELTLTELATQRFDLDGKIIETEITGAYSFTQVAKGKYKAYCVYYSGGTHLSSGGESVFFGEDGKEFFQKMSEKDYWSGGKKKIYVLIEKKKLTVVGTRFKKSKGTYSW